MPSRQGTRGQADALSRAAKRTSGVAADHPAHEKAAALTARVELTGGDHIVLDPARGSAPLDQLDIFSSDIRRASSQGGRSAVS